MDVNETLKTLREALADWHRAADKVVTSVESLDEWLAKGGFLPADWTAIRTPVTTSAWEGYES